MADTKKKAKKMLSSFTILFIILLVVALASIIVSIVCPGKRRCGRQPEQLYHVAGAPLCRCAGWCACSLWCWAAFLAIISEDGRAGHRHSGSGAQPCTAKSWAHPVLMTIFSIGGTTCGMCEETVPFYMLLAATVFAAGFDPLVGRSHCAARAPAWAAWGPLVNPLLWAHVSTHPPALVLK